MGSVRAEHFDERAILMDYVAASVLSSSSRRCTRCCTPRRTATGARSSLLWTWEADPMRWQASSGSILVPDRWNKQVQMAWRYYPCELALPGRAQPPPRAPRVSACETRMRVIICYLGLGRSLAHVGHAIQQYCALFAWYVLSEHALTFRKPRKYFHQIRVHRGVLRLSHRLRYLDIYYANGVSKGCQSPSVWKSQAS